MESLVFVLWLLPGATLHFFWKRKKIDSNADSWRLILPLAFISLTFFGVSRLVKLLLSQFDKTGSHLSNFLSWWTVNVVQLPYSVSLVASVVLAVILGVCFDFAVGKAIRDQDKNSTVLRMARYFGFENFDDDLQFALYHLAGKRAIISLKSNRVYQGIITGLPAYRDDRTVTVRPIWSGSRQENASVVYDTYYPSKEELNELGYDVEVDFRLTISLDDFSTLASYDEKVDNFFRETGKTVYDPKFMVDSTVSGS